MISDVPTWTVLLAGMASLIAVLFGLGKLLRALGRYFSVMDRFNDVAETVFDIAKEFKPDAGNSLSDRLSILSMGQSSLISRLEAHIEKITEVEVQASEGRRLSITALELVKEQIALLNITIAQMTGGDPRGQLVRGSSNEEDSDE